MSDLLHAQRRSPRRTFAAIGALIAAAGTSAALLPARSAAAATT